MPVSYTNQNTANTAIITNNKVSEMSGVKVYNTLYINNKI